MFCIKLYTGALLQVKFLEASFQSCPLNYLLNKSFVFVGWLTGVFAFLVLCLVVSGF